MTDEIVASLGRVLVVVGLGIALLGAVLWLGGRIPFLGNLPGDIRIERGDLTVFIPLGTMLLVSIVASVVLALVGRR